MWLNIYVKDNMVRNKDLKKKIKFLQDYCQKRDDLLMAFLFGSFASHKQTEDSDVDLAVYLKPLGKNVEWEEKREYPQEDEVWGDLERIMEKNTDLVILNRTNPVLAFDILKNGIPLAIKDKNLYWKFYEIVEREAEDFSEFMEDYVKIKLSAKSLSDETRRRLLQRFDYLLTYWPEKDKFLKLDFDTYQHNLDQRRNIERWVENIANCTIDLAKIILASEKRQMPKSYKEVLFDFGLFLGLNEEEAKKFSKVAPLRNILVHEYLDILYKRIKDFLVNTSPFYERLLNFLKNYIDKSG